LGVAQKIAKLRKPDILVVDSTVLNDEAKFILRLFKEQHKHIVRVVLVKTHAQKNRWSGENADFALQYGSLNREFPMIVRHVQEDIDARLAPSP
jgi:hypothetical protein